MYRFDVLQAAQLHQLVERLGAFVRLGSLARGVPPLLLHRGRPHLPEGNVTVGRRARRFENLGGVGGLVHARLRVAHHRVKLVLAEQAIALGAASLRHHPRRRILGGVARIGASANAATARCGGGVRRAGRFRGARLRRLLRIEREARQAIGR